MRIRRELTADVQLVEFETSEVKLAISFSEKKCFCSVRLRASLLTSRIVPNRSKWLDGQKFSPLERSDVSSMASERDDRLTTLRLFIASEPGVDSDPHWLLLLLWSLFPALHVFLFFFSFLSCCGHGFPGLKH